MAVKPDRKSTITAIMTEAILEIEYSQEIHRRSVGALAVLVVQDTLLYR